MPGRQCQGLVSPKPPRDKRKVNGAARLQPGLWAGMQRPVPLPFSRQCVHWQVQEKHCTLWFCHLVCKSGVVLCTFLCFRFPTEQATWCPPAPGPSPTAHPFPGWNWQAHRRGPFTLSPGFRSGRDCQGAFSTEHGDHVQGGCRKTLRQGGPWDMLCMSDRRWAQADEGEGSRLRIMTGRQLEGGEVGPICSSPQTLDLDCLITF